MCRRREAIACYEEAIPIYKRLVEVERRGDLANDLAAALVNKAVSLEELKQWQDALTCYDEAIRWRETCVREGMTHLSPDLQQTLRYRMMMLLALHRWDAAAADAARINAIFEFSMGLASAREALQEEHKAFVEHLRTLSDEERDRLYAALGEEEVESLARWIEPNVSRWLFGRRGPRGRGQRR